MKYVAMVLTTAYLVGMFSVGVADAFNRKNTKMGQNLADSSISVGHVTLTTVFHDAIHDTATYNMDPTDMSAVNYHSSGLDLDVFDYAYQSPNWGWWECHDWFVEDIGGPPVICQKSHVHIDTYAPPGGSWSLTEAKSLMCEEVGHGSLNHSSDSDSCMSQDWADTRWNSHDRSETNQNYEP